MRSVADFGLVTATRPHRSQTGVVEGAPEGGVFSFWRSGRIEASPLREKEKTETQRKTDVSWQLSTRQVLGKQEVIHYIKECITHCSLRHTRSVTVESKEELHGIKRRVS